MTLLNERNASYSRMVALIRLFLLLPAQDINCGASFRILSASEPAIN
jgi:hypothetical protein